MADQARGERMIQIFVYMMAHYNNRYSVTDIMRHLDFREEDLRSVQRDMQALSNIGGGYIKRSVESGKNSSCGTAACMCPKVRSEHSEAELKNAELVGHEWCSSKAQINCTMAHAVAIFGFTIAGLVMQDIYQKALASAE